MVNLCLNSFCDPSRPRIRYMSGGLKKLLGYTVVVLLVSVGYYVYVIAVHPPSIEQETFFSEIGEGIGETALWIFVFIYFRTALKLLIGKGSLARRLLPDYSLPEAATYVQRLLVYLDRTHVYFGIAAVALVLIHIAFMGLHVEILFFPAVLTLVLWQGLFGMFLSWRYSPRDLRKLSYYVHAQLVTGVGIGLFAYFGHLLVDD